MPRSREQLLSSPRRRGDSDPHITWEPIYSLQIPRAWGELSHRRSSPGDQGQGWHVPGAFGTRARAVAGREMLPRPEGWVGGGTEPTALGSSVCHRARAAPTDTGGSGAGETQLLLPRRAGLTPGPTCRQPGHPVGSLTDGTHGSFPAAPRERTRQVRIPTHRPSSGPGRRGERGELGPGVAPHPACGPRAPPDPRSGPAEPAPLGGLASAAPAPPRAAGQPPPAAPPPPPRAHRAAPFQRHVLPEQEMELVQEPHGRAHPPQGLPRSAHGSPVAHRHSQQAAAVLRSRLGGSGAASAPAQPCAAPPPGRPPATAH